MKCEKCNSELKKGEPYCGECGTKQVRAKSEKRFCEECGTVIKEGNNFCGECGKKVLKNTFKETKPMDPKKKKATVIALGVVSILAIVYFVLSSLASPVTVAKDFCEGLKNNDYNKVFNTLDLPKSDYLSAEKLKTMIEDEVEIKSCTVKKFDSNENMMIYKLAIITKDDEENTTTLEINKMKEKKFLLFDKWLIKMDEMVVDEWRISVPESAKLFIDGKEITEKSSDSDSIGYDTYVIKNTFNTAKYEINVSHDLYKDYKEEIKPTYSTKVEMELKGEFTSEVKKFLEEMYNVALLNDSNDNLEKLITSDFKDDATKLVENVKTTILYASCLFGDCYYKDIEIDDVTISNKQSVSKDEIKFKVNFTIDYEYSDEENGTYKEKNSKYYLNLDIKSVNGKWLISGKN